MTESRRRLTALAILFAVVAAVWLAVIQPVADAFATQSAEIDDLHSQLALYRTRIALKPIVEVQLAALKEHEASSTGLIAGNSPELAAANIQNAVKTLIESDGGQIRTAQNLTPTTADGFQRIEIQYEASVPMARLKHMAYRIETGVPFLFLDAVDLRAPENWQNAGVALDPPPLDVRWTVHGYRWTGPQ